METYDILALSLGGFVLIVFFIIAIRHESLKLGLNHFLFGLKDLKSNSFSATLIASGTSLATVVFFFLTTGKMYGLWLIIAPISYSFGLLLLKRIFEKISNEIPYDQLGTISQFLEYRTGSKLLGLLADLCSVLGFIAILLIEVIIGVQIFNYFVEVENIQLFAFISIMVIISVYVLHGGYRAVIESDQWQYRLMVAGIYILFFYVLYIILIKPENIIYSFGNRLLGETKFPALGVFLLNVLFVNIFTPTSQLSTWQRFAASSSKEDALKGLNSGLLKILLLWLALTFSGIVFSSISNNISSTKDIFTIITNIDIAGKYIVFPLLFSGMLAALLSTADTGLITIIYSISHSNFTPINTQNKNQKFIISSVIIIGAIVTLIYILIRKSVGVDLLSIIFTLFGQLCILGPPIFLSILTSRKINTFGVYLICTGILISIFTLWFTSFYGMATSNFILSQSATPISISISLIFSIVTWLFCIKKEV